MGNIDNFSSTYVVLLYSSFYLESKTIIILGLFFDPDHTIYSAPILFCCGKDLWDSTRDEWPFSSI